MRFTHIYAKYQIFSKAAIKHLSNLFLGDPFQKHPSYAPNESLYKLIDFIYVKSKFTFIYIDIINKVERKEKSNIILRQLQNYKSIGFFLLDTDEPKFFVAYC